MRRIVCFLQFALFGFALASPALGGTGAPVAAEPSNNARVLFRGATLIDGTGGPARAGMDVLVVGERIERMFPDAKLDPDVAKTAKIVELGGRFLMPGMIDAHVHLATPPNRRQAEAVLRRDIYGGVTAVRDMADDLRAVGDLARRGSVRASCPACLGVANRPGCAATSLVPPVRSATSTRHRR